MVTISVIPGYMQVGKIVAAQGLKGEVRIYPESDFPERFLTPGKRWLLLPGAAEPQPIELLQGRYLDGKGLYVVQFAGVGSREQSEALRGAAILVLDTDLPELDEDEYRVQDLIGLPVYDQASQTLIGTVKRVLPAGNDLLEIERVTATDPKNSLVLVPFVKPIVPVVDLKQRRIEITPPPGLFDL